jgi:hypothetical protein
MRLESGPAAYDRNYYLIFLLLCIALGAYFYYDYMIGYPKKNLEAAKKQLAPLVGLDVDPKTLSETPSKPTFEELKKSAPTDLAAVHDKLGKPFERKEFGDGSVVEYFASTYGMAIVPSVNGRVNPKQMDWTTWSKTKEEIRIQLYCALIAFAVGLYVLYRVYKAITLRAVIDEEGMTYGGRRISFDDMKRLCDYNRKGWVDLYYQRGPQERRLRIDNQKIRKFDEVIDTLCEAKGFEDPRQADEQAEPAGPADAGAESAEADDDEETSAAEPKE